MNHVSKSLLVIALASMLGCATTNTQNDVLPNMYRTIPERISDEAIERSAYKGLTNIKGVSENSVRIGIDSFRREVLLTGEVPSQQIQNDVVKMISFIHDVDKIYDFLTVTPTPKAQSHTLHDNYLKSKILAKSSKKGNIKSSQYKLVVRNNTAYLLGFLTPSQENQLIESIADVQGMEGVKVLSTRVDGISSNALSNSVVSDSGAESDGLVYGGSSTQSATQGTYATSQSSYNNAYQPQTNQSHAVVRMEGSPTSSYVNLYNNTDKP